MVKDMRTTFRRTRATAFFFLFFCLAVAGRVGVGLAASPTAGTSAPDFVLKSLAGDNLRLSEYRGEVVMPSFWASWCSDCRSQLADINAIYNDLHESGLQSLTISMERNLHDANDMRGEIGLGYPVLNDSDLDVSRLYDIQSLPILVLIDREGNVQEVVEGYDRGSDENYSKLIEALLLD